MSSDKTNSGGLWKNERRTKDTHPNATGAALIECPCGKQTDYFVDAWTNDKDGVKWQRLMFKAKDKQPPTAKAQPVGSGDDDDCPF